MKIKDLLEATIRRLGSFSDTPQLDAQVLLAHIIQKPRTWVIAHPEHALGKEKRENFELALKKLEVGEPFPYVLGKWDFFGLEFDITKDVLIPRPETELLVEKAITWLKAHPEKRNIADIGTGSGIIAIAIAKHIPDASILATDISTAALWVAKCNAEKFNAQDRIEFAECDLLPESDAKGFDLLCSNPPYIPSGALRELPIFGREPTLALDGGADGLEIYRRLFKLVPDRLAADGMILLETEASLGIKVLSLAYDTFTDVSIHLHQDLTGRDRLIEIQFRE